MSDGTPPPDRKKVTFSQAEGLEPLPEPLKLGELSREARSLLWRELLEELNDTGQRFDYADSTVGRNWEKILYDWHVEVLHEPADEFDPRLDHARASVKSLIYDSDWNRVLDFVQFVMRRKACPSRLPGKINWCLEKSRAAYLVVPDPPTIMPRATPQEGEAVEQALADLKSAGLEGARNHLIRAGEQLNGGKFADSVRESIHAVESIACKLDPKASKTLGPALQALEKHKSVHPALREGFKKIYGYTSDEGGIRHALLENEAKVELEDAVFMIGACASFSSYLLGKARKARLISE